MPEDVEIGPGGEEAAFASEGKVIGENDKEGVMGSVGRAMENLGLAGRGKGGEKKRRKGTDGLVDV